MNFRILILTFFVASCACGWAEELSSKNNYKLKAVYETLPKTDGNSDGILTVEELKTYVQTKFKDHANSRSNFYLKRFLKSEPKADLNQDGILTKTELLSHLNTQEAHYKSELSAKA